MTVDNLNKTGAVRSADADLFSYTSLPMLGLMAVARTAAEGKAKYGRLNYKQGMPVHQYLDHVFHHLVRDQEGDRSEPNLEHAVWGLLAAIDSRIKFPELNAPHELGEDGLLTPAAKAYLDEHAADLSARRKAGEFASIGNWKLTDLPDVQRGEKLRQAQRLAKMEFAPVCVAAEQEFCPCDTCSYPADAYDPAAFDYVAGEMKEFLSSPLNDELYASLSRGGFKVSKSEAYGSEGYYDVWNDIGLGHSEYVGCFAYRADVIDYIDRKLAEVDAQILKAVGGGQQFDQGIPIDKAALDQKIDDEILLCGGDVFEFFDKQYEGLPTILRRFLMDAKHSGHLGDRFVVAHDIAEQAFLVNDVKLTKAELRTADPHPGQPYVDALATFRRRLDEQGPFAVPAGDKLTRVEQQYLKDEFAKRLPVGRLVEPASDPVARLEEYYDQYPGMYGSGNPIVGHFEVEHRDGDGALVSKTILPNVVSSEGHNTTLDVVTVPVAGTTFCRGIPVAEVTRVNGTKETVTGTVKGHLIAFNESIVMNNGDSVRMLVATGAGADAFEHPPILVEGMPLPGLAVDGLGKFTQVFGGFDRADDYSPNG